MSKADEIKGIKRLEGRGITAKVTDTGKQFGTYARFARAVGYPSASGYDRADKLKERSDELFRVLAKGAHELDLYGEVYVIESADGERFLVERRGLELFGEYRTENELASATLKEDAEELIAEMRRQAYAEGYEQGKFDANIESEWLDNINPPTIDELLALGRETLAEPAQDKRDKKERVNVGQYAPTTARVFLKEQRSKTAQEKRDEIVERAKKDVEGLREYIDAINFKGDAYFVKAEQIIGNHSNVGAACDVEFIVNKEKRTIVALMKGVTTGTLYAKGISKCAPDDCFNTHLGRAISLRRALGFPVPSEYLNAPQPTEVRVGDEVEFTTFGEYKRRTVSEIEWNKYQFTSGTWINKSYDMRINDDSREDD